jgi:hypothetical protein
VALFRYCTEKKPPPIYNFTILEYVAQKDAMGCLIASTAMVLDMTYDEVAKFIPFHDPNALYETGNAICDQMFALAEKQGRKFDDVLKPFLCEADKRYIGILPAREGIRHAVAIDEFGVVFDPADESSLRFWTDCEFEGLLGFFLVAGSQQPM